MCTPHFRGFYFTRLVAAPGFPFRSVDQCFCCTLQCSQRRPSSPPHLVHHQDLADFAAVHALIIPRLVRPLRGKGILVQVDARCTVIICISWNRPNRPGKPQTRPLPSSSPLSRFDSRPSPRTFPTFPGNPVAPNHCRRRASPCCYPSFVPICLWNTSSLQIRTPRPPPSGKHCSARGSVSILIPWNRYFTSPSSGNVASRPTGRKRYSVAFLPSHRTIHFASTGRPVWRYQFPKFSWPSRAVSASSRLGLFPLRLCDPLVSWAVSHPRRLVWPSRGSGFHTAL